MRIARSINRRIKQEFHASLNAGWLPSDSVNVDNCTEPRGCLIATPLVYQETYSRALNLFFFLSFFFKGGSRSQAPIGRLIMRQLSNMALPRGLVLDFSTSLVAGSSQSSFVYYKSNFFLLLYYC